MVPQASHHKDVRIRELEQELDAMALRLGELHGSEANATRRALR